MNVQARNLLFSRLEIMILPNEAISTLGFSGDKRKEQDEIPYLDGRLPNECG